MMVELNLAKGDLVQKDETVNASNQKLQEATKELVRVFFNKLSQFVKLKFTYNVKLMHTNNLYNSIKACSNPQSSN